VNGREDIPGALGRAGTYLAEGRPEARARLRSLRSEAGEARLLTAATRIDRMLAETGETARIA